MKDNDGNNDDNEREEGLNNKDLHVEMNRLDGMNPVKVHAHIVANHATSSFFNLYGTGVISNAKIISAVKINTEKNIPILIFRYAADLWMYSFEQKENKKHHPFVSIILTEYKEK